LIENFSAQQESLPPTVLKEVFYQNFEFNDYFDPGRQTLRSDCPECERFEAQGFRQHPTFLIRWLFNW
jgi:hypothetical protein